MDKGIIVGGTILALLVGGSFVINTRDYINQKIEDGIKSQNNSVLSRIDGLESKASIYDNTLGEIQSKLSQQNWVALVPTDGSGYDVVQTTIGPFLVIAGPAVQYLDGYKVTIRIGNLTTANMNGATITVGWFDLGDKAPQYHNHEFEVTNKFMSGRYTSAEVFLSPAKAFEVKMINVKLSFNNIDFYSAD